MLQVSRKFNSSIPRTGLQLISSVFLKSVPVPYLLPSVQAMGVRTFNPMHFQPMQFQPLPFQSLTISTYCIFNCPLFRHKLIVANGS